MEHRSESVLRGSVWLMASAVLAKLLGAVFRIPLTALLGGSGMGYYSCAYGLFLPVFALSVTGMNTAVAALTAQMRAKGDRVSAERIAANAKRMFGIAGAAGSIVLFLSADALCGTLLQNPHAALAVKCFSPAVWFCCINAVLRGLHEGRRTMQPTAVSQVAEGIGRVLFGLLLCVLVLHFPNQIKQYLPGGTTTAEAAAAAAILGVTISTAVGTLTLLCFRLHPRREPIPQYKPDKASDRALRRALLGILLPVAAASLVTNLTTLIDLAAGLRVLSGVMLRDPLRFGLSAAVSSQEASEYANFCYGAYSGLAVTVFNLVPSVTNMLGKGVLPAFAESFVRHDSDAVQHHAETVLRRTAFLAFPAGLGIAVLAEPILMLLFASRAQEVAAAAPPLVWLGAAVLPAACAYPLFSMMQAAGFAGDTVTVMLIGAAVKLAGNLLLIPHMGLRGAAIATAICYLCIFLLAYGFFRRRTGACLHIAAIFGKTLAAACFCAAAARTVYTLLISGTSRMAALTAAVIAGGSSYLIAYLLLPASKSQTKIPEIFMKNS